MAVCRVLLHAKAEVGNPVILHRDCFTFAQRGFGFRALNLQLDAHDLQFLLGLKNEFHGCFLGRCWAPRLLKSKQAAMVVTFSVIGTTLTEIVHGRKRRCTAWIIPHYSNCPSRFLRKGQL